MTYLLTVLGTYVVTRWIGPWAAASAKACLGRDILRLLFDGCYRDDRGDAN